MMNSPNTIQLSPVLQLQRQNWLNAYQNKSTDIMGMIETQNFFVVFYNNVEKKSDWHNNVKNFSQDNDPLLALMHSDKTIKVRYDCLSASSCIITSYIKEENQTTLIKEMWEEQNKVWQISSLVINLTMSKPL